MDQLVESLNETVNGTLNDTAVDGKAFTPQAALASSALFLMAIIPIFIGSHRSVNAVKKSLENLDELQIFSKKDAGMFPLYASCALFSIYMVFKIFAVEYINLLMSFYFFFLGSSTIFFLIRDYVISLVPESFPNSKYKLSLAELKASETPQSEECLGFEFERKDVFPLALSLMVGITYVLTKHWVANNCIGIAISVVAIELLHLDKAVNGCILLSGLFFYDIFWVFGTNVMVSVATKFDAPIKVVFPRDLFTGGFLSKNVSMLGLGDIVIPGIFIALLLRFDARLNRNGSRTYFLAGYVAYIIGLLITFSVMFIFRHAQPALLYLVPTCLGIPLSLALIKGDFAKLMEYQDVPEEVKAAKEAKDKADADAALAKKET